jgi:hypothetical protein
MNIYRSSAFVSVATIVVAALVTVQCGSSPAAPGNATPALSAVTLNAASAVPGASMQGTVSLTSAASTGGASVALSSSNSAVVTVPASVAIQAGSSSGTFTITAVGPGTAVITASVNGSSRQSPTLTVGGGNAVALRSIELSASSVIGGTSLVGSVNLTAPAPAGGAVVSLSGADPVTVPASVTVPAGSSTAPFTISTKTVGGPTSATISGSYGGASASATLSVTRAEVATASFGVSGPTETSTCELANGGTTLNCTFNGSTSTAPGTITAWDWTYGVATTFTQTTTGPVLTAPTAAAAAGQSVVLDGRHAQGARQPGQCQCGDHRQRRPPAATGIVRVLNGTWGLIKGWRQGLGTDWGLGTRD